MNTIKIKSLSRKEIKSVIAKTFSKLNAGDIDMGTYEAIVEVLCTTYGTEYIASIFVEMTKEGWQG